ncbi:MAG: PPC domain-containing DNA-binding protein [Candidatus Anammoxibacter sp.]
MKFTEAKQGRIFVIRLENNETLHEVIEKFAVDMNIKAASLTVIGGANKDSKIIVGPENGETKPVVPMEYTLKNVHEIIGAGTIFPDSTGKPILHMHIASGRSDSTITGCIRRGVKIWQVAEVVLFELTDTKAVRKYDNETGFELLSP